MAVSAGNHVLVRPSEERAADQQVDDCLACGRIQPAEARHLDKRDLQPRHFNEFPPNAARDAVEIHGRHWPFSCFAAGAITRKVFCWQESGRNSQCLRVGYSPKSLTFQAISSMTSNAASNKNVRTAQVDRHCRRYPLIGVVHWPNRERSGWFCALRFLA
jgi:hypothetical protein